MRQGRGACADVLRRALFAACRRSPEFKDRRPVAGDGPCPCDLMIVGEAPGRDETREGRPFVGRAGRFFTGLLEGAVKLERKDIYITNAVKVWPVVNTPRGRTRPPTRGEAEFFLPLLLREIELVGPKVIVAVGRTAFTALCPEGEFRPGRFSAGRGGIRVMPVYHPAYILRKQRELPGLTADLKRALARVGRELA